MKCCLVKVRFIELLPIKTLREFTKLCKTMFIIKDIFYNTDSYTLVIVMEYMSLEQLSIKIHGYDELIKSIQIVS